MPAEPRKSESRKPITKKVAVSKFPLRLMPSVRVAAQASSAKDGVSLNQFINVAVAEKLAHLEHDAWVRNRKVPTQASLAKALRLLDEGGDNPPEPGDELPKGYQSAYKPQRQ